MKRASSGRVEGRIGQNAGEPGTSAQSKAKAAKRETQQQAADFINEEELLKSVHSAVIQSSDDLVERIKENSTEPLSFDPEVLSRVSSLVFDTLSEDWAKDLLAFSGHANRVAVNAEDVSLVMRRNDHLTRIVHDVAGFDGEKSMKKGKTAAPKRRGKMTVKDEAIFVPEDSRPKATSTPFRPTVLPPAAPPLPFTPIARDTGSRIVVSAMTPNRFHAIREENEKDDVILEEERKRVRDDDRRSVENTTPVPATVVNKTVKKSDTSVFGSKKGPSVDFDSFDEDEFGLEEEGPPKQKSPQEVVLLLSSPEPELDAKEITSSKTACKVACNPSSSQWAENERRIEEKSPGEPAAKKSFVQQDSFDDDDEMWFLGDKSANSNKKTTEKQDEEEQKKSPLLVSNIFGETENEDEMASSAGSSDVFGDTPPPARKVDSNDEFDSFHDDFVSIPVPSTATTNTARTPISAQNNPNSVKEKSSIDHAGSKSSFKTGFSAFSFGVSMDDSPDVKSAGKIKETPPSTSKISLPQKGKTPVQKNQPATKSTTPRVRQISEDSFDDDFSIMTPKKREEKKTPRSGTSMSNKTKRSSLGSDSSRKAPSRIGQIIDSFNDEPDSFDDLD